MIDVELEATPRGVRQRSDTDTSVHAMRISVVASRERTRARGFANGGNKIGDNCTDVDTNIGARVKRKQEIEERRSRTTEFYCGDLGCAVDPRTIERVWHLAGMYGEPVSTEKERESSFPCGWRDSQACGIQAVEPTCEELPHSCSQRQQISISYPVLTKFRFEKTAQNREKHDPQIARQITYYGHPECRDPSCERTVVGKKRSELRGLQSRD